MLSTPPVIVLSGPVSGLVLWGGGCKESHSFLPSYEYEVCHSAVLPAVLVNFALLLFSRDFLSAPATFHREDRGPAGACGHVASTD
jgi:hypothetical protein